MLWFDLIFIFWPGSVLIVQYSTEWLLFLKYRKSNLCNYPHRSCVHWRMLSPPIVECWTKLTITIKIYCIICKGNQCTLDHFSGMQMYLNSTLAISIRPTNIFVCFGTGRFRMQSFGRHSSFRCPRCSLSWFETSWLSLQYLHSLAFLSVTATVNRFVWRLGTWVYALALFFYQFSHLK